MQSDARLYDAIVLGSSPICLIEALHRARGGESVLILDRAHSVGGAWQTIEAFGFQNVEISTHIMRPFRKGYRYIEDTLRIPMFTMQPQPFWVLEKFGPMPRRTKYAHTWNIVFYRTIAQFFSREGIRQIVRSPKANLFGPLATGLIWIWNHLRIGAPAAKYPVGGAPQFMQKLHELVAQESIEIRTGTDVRSMFVDGPGRRVVVETDRGTVYGARLYMTPQTQIERVASVDKEIRLSPQAADSTHLHMIVDDPAGRLFSFARFQAHSVYFMVSDISDYAKGFKEAQPGRKLIAAWCTDRFNDSTDAIGEALSNLKDNGLVGPQARVVDHRVTTYASKALTTAECRSIRDAFGEFIEVLETDNLTLNISDYFERWKVPASRDSNGKAT